MPEAILRRDWSSAVLAAGASILLGALVAIQPRVAIGLIGVSLVALLAVRRPVAHLMVLLFLTAIVPYTVENTYHVGGGSPGLLASDLFLLTGLARAAVLLPRLPLDRRRLVVIGLTFLFCLITVVAAYRGLGAGRSVSAVGAEGRTLAGGFATALIALATLQGRGAHERVMRGLLVFGVILGLWGIAQWVLGLSFGGDFGVRAGVSLTSNGQGQLQGGLFVFPVAVILSVAALVSGQVRGGTQRTVVLVVLALNTISLLLTFERTFWVVTVAGLAVVILRSGRARRGRAVLWGFVGIVVATVVLSTALPGTLQTARERLLSIDQYQTDNSLRYRSVESRNVMVKIRQDPVFGSGLGASIYWGRPWERVPPSTQTYTHNGFLWLTWRAGLLGAAVALTLLGLSIGWRGRAAAGPLVAALRTGCQASLLALLVANVTFPVFQGYEITFVLGFLIAYCALPVSRSGGTHASATR